MPALQHQQGSWSRGHKNRIETIMAHYAITVVDARLSPSRSLPPESTHFYQQDGSKSGIYMMIKENIVAHEFPIDPIPVSSLAPLSYCIRLWLLSQDSLQLQPAARG
ncbi:hypothetical protein ACLKA7_014955 [Drosophila subpalustris]